MSGTNELGANQNSPAEQPGLYHNHPQARQRPSAPAWPQTAAAAVALIIAVTPSLYDFIYVTLTTKTLYPLSAFGLAAFTGLTIKLCRSGCAEAAGLLHAANWSGLIGGLLVGAGLGLMRVAHTEGRREVAIAILFTAAEIWGAKILQLGRAYSAYAVGFRGCA